PVGYRPARTPFSGFVWAQARPAGARVRPRRARRAAGLWLARQRSRARAHDRASGGGGGHIGAHPAGASRAAARSWRRRAGAPGGQAATAGLTLAEVEKRHILRTLDSAGGNRTRAAQLLDIGRNTLQRKLRTYGIE